MTTSTPAQAPKTGPAHHLWRLTSFATSPQARPALLGALGAVLIAAGTVCGVTYVFHARRKAGPIIDLSLLRIPTFAASIWGGALVYVGNGRQPPSWIGELLAGRDRTRAAPTFASAGLYFIGVDYPTRFNLPATCAPLRIPLS